MALIGWSVSRAHRALPYAGPAQSVGNLQVPSEECGVIAVGHASDGVLALQDIPGMVLVHLDGVRVDPEVINTLCPSLLRVPSPAPSGWFNKSCSHIFIDAWSKCRCCRGCLDLQNSARYASNCCSKSAPMHVSTHHSEAIRCSSTLLVAVGYHALLTVAQTGVEPRSGAYLVSDMLEL